MGGVGKRFNSPNDVVEHSDGSLWFTDPDYGIASDYEGVRAEPEIDGCHVYRLDPRNGEVRIVADDFVRPNGLAFSADESRLYIADTRERHIRVFDVDGAGLSGGEVAMECSAGSSDGMRFDDAGRLWAATHDGVHCFHPEGDLLGKLLIPQVVSNLCWGGLRLNHLFITATRTLYTIRLNVNGLR